MNDKASIDMHLILISDTRTEYRLRPNPDLPAEVEAVKGGMVLEWRDRDDAGGWSGYFFIPPDVCHALPEALAKFGFGKVVE